MGVEFENCSCDLDHIPFRGGLSSKSYDLIHSAKYNDSHSEISLGAPKFKVSHLAVTTPLLRVICSVYAGTLYSLPVFKILI